MHEVEATTRQILMIDHGRIVAEGDVGNVRRQMHDRPYAIRVRVNEARRLATELIDWDTVTGVKLISGDALIVETSAPDQVHDRLPGTILKQGLTAREIAAADAGLEAVFGYLTSGRTGAATGGGEGEEAGTD